MFSTGLFGNVYITGKSNSLLNSNIQTPFRPPIALTKASFQTF